MNKYTFITLVYLILMTIAFFIQSLAYGILLTILASYIFIPKKTKPKWLNLQVFGILLSFIYILISSESLSHFGFSLGSWNKHLVEYIIISLIMLGIPRIIDYKTKGNLVFQPMKVRVIFFWMFVVGFGEEILFRGIIQSEFGFWTATLSFGLFHAFNLLTIVKEKSFNRRHLQTALNFALITGAGGAVLGYVYHLTGSIFAVALLHGLFDLCNHLFPPERDLKDNKLFKAVHHL